MPTQNTSIPAAPEDAKQQIIAFLNQNGFAGQFQVNVGWLSDPNYDFTMNVSDAMADAWENRALVMQDFERMARRLGYEYDLEGEPGSHAHKFHFFKTSTE